MDHAIGSGPGPDPVGKEPEGVHPREVVGVDGRVPGVGLDRGTRPPEQESTDAALVGDEVDPEVRTQRANTLRYLHPPRRGDQVVALGCGRELVGVPVVIGGRTGLGRGRHACHARRSMAAPRIEDLRTPALVVDAAALDHNLATMADARPGPSCRPHIKAHKTTALAQRQRDAGHVGFTCATPREIIGMATVGLGDDLLLANEVVDAERLRAMAELDARVTIAIDSDTTLDAARAAGLRACLIDVNVGLPRCGCLPDDAGRLADRARTAGMEVRGVMGYEGHVVGLTDRAERVRMTAECMDLLAAAHDAVGGDIVSAGGTGTFDCNDLATEIQAGSYALMDSAYDALDLPFRPALWVLATVVSVNARDGYAVADCGLKSLGMDHGDPSVTLGAGSTTPGAVWFCSDEHLTFGAGEGESLPSVGDRVRVWPAHVDPTVAYHERLHVTAGDEVIDEWPVDLRSW